MILQIARAIDDIRNNLKDIDKTIIDKGIKSLEEMISKEEDKEALQNARLWVANVPNNFIFYIINCIKVTYKCLKWTRKLADTTPEVAFEKILKLPEYLQLIEQSTGVKPNDLKLTINDGMVYIETSNDEEFTKRTGGGACIHTGISPGADGKNKNVFTDKNVNPLEMNMGNLPPAILISSSVKPEYLKFTYYHELGHAVTGQNERVVELEDARRTMGALQLYTEHFSEVRADAYAMINCGLNPETTWDMRFKIFTEIGGHPEEDINPLKEKYIENLKKESQFAISLAKVGPWKFLKYKQFFKK